MDDHDRFFASVRNSTTSPPPLMGAGALGAGGGGAVGSPGTGHGEATRLLSLPSAPRPQLHSLSSDPGSPLFPHDAMRWEVRGSTQTTAPLDHLGLGLGPLPPLNLPSFGGSLGGGGMGGSGSAASDGLLFHSPTIGGLAGLTVALGPEFEEQLLLHPLFPKLIKALCACRQMLAAGGGEGTRLDDAGRRALSARQDALRARRAHGLGDEVPGGDDPELQDFLEQFIAVLEQYHLDLASVMQVIDRNAKEFDSSVAQLLQAALTGAALREAMEAAPEAPGPARRQRTTGSTADAPTESEDTVVNASSSLKRKYIQRMEQLSVDFAKKRRKGKLPSEATEALKSWWEANIDNPYPTESVKRRLLQQTGLDMTQLNNWFINQRKRHWRQNTEAADAYESPSSN